ncbi:uncharacterized protein C8Q71DRAFT_729992 [Rhodofomes roseus]|uniref:NAD(P)-binding protein n=1 Tax=Rhodofomes roseus TaxID=34475 RepID=A0ABQ8KWT8_9APHY|nr:uncharacterized protein C8Q71DRAFT_729992 [Rhodofomes roseus]KAH9843767.1 hypothetical protein C8Q71DRAFT_729992 [Rhodofomes roseus]
MTELVLKNGDSAVATLRKPEALAELSFQHGAGRLLVLKLDVTKPQEIHDAFSEAVERFGRIDVVFNNAGYSMLSEVEGAPEEAGRALFDVNVWGAVNVSNQAVHVFRDVNKPAGGTLLQVSSLLGLYAYPTFGHYSASKYALEGVSTALAEEVEPEWKIKIVLIEPGNFGTSAISNLVRIPPHPAYTKSTATTTKVREWVKEDSFDTPADAGKAVAAIYRIAQLPDPPLHLVLGKDAVERVRGKAAKLLADIDRFASWSEDLDAKA